MILQLIKYQMNLLYLEKTKTEQLKLLNIRLKEFLVKCGTVKEKVNSENLRLSLLNSFLIIIQNENNYTSSWGR